MWPSAWDAIAWNGRDRAFKAGGGLERLLQHALHSAALLKAGFAWIGNGQV